MPDAPSRFYLDEIRNLRGAPKVSSPFSHPASVKAERVASRSSQDAPPVYGALDPDPLLAAKGCRLTVIQKLATDLGKTEYYTVHEALGTREEQDLWNRKDSYPYLLATNPRLTRTYRFFFDDLPTFVIGTTTDTEVTSATLITLLEQDENAVVKDFTAIFDDIPSADVQAGVGLTPDGIVALGVSIAYPESPLFPVVSWAFRALKSEYVAPTGVNAACPIPGYTTLVQTNESVAPSPDEPEVVIVTREYQILPGAVVTSPDTARLPRTLTAIPGTYLNGDTLIKTVQKVLPGTSDDPLINGVLSSKVDATSLWYAVKTNFTRASQTYPVLYLPRTVDEYGGAEGKEMREIVEVATPNLLDAATDTAISNLLTDNTAFQVISYSVNALSPTQSEVVYTVVPAFPLLVGVEQNLNIPERFLAAFDIETQQGWVDITGTETGDVAIENFLVSSYRVLSCKITPLTPERAKRVTTLLPIGATLPTLSGDEAGRPAELYPGIFSDGGGGTEVYQEAVVATGGTFTSTISGAYELSRTPIDANFQVLRLGTRSPSGGVTSYTGGEINPDGSTSTIITILDGSLGTPGYDTLSSEVRPAGAGHTEAVTRTQNGSFPTLAELEGAKLPIPERFLAGLVLSTAISTVVPTTTPDAGSGVLSSTVRPKEGSSVRSLKTTVNLPTGTTATSLSPLIGTDTMARDADGAPVTETESFVAVGTPAPTDLTFLDIGLRDQPVGGGLALRTRRSAAAFPVITEYDVFDREHNVLLREDHQIVDASLVTSPTAPSGGVAVTFKAIDKWRSIKITRTLVLPSSIPDTFDSEAYRRPSLLASISAAIGPSGRTAINYGVLKGFPYIAKTRIVTAIASGLTPTALSSLWHTADIRYDGILFSLYVPDILTDGFSLSISSGNAGPLFNAYGNVSESVTQTATNITASGYLALVGTEVVLRSPVSSYGWGLTIRKDHYLTLQ